MLRRIVFWSFFVVVALGGAIFVAFQVSPWPRVLIIRYAFETEAQRVAAALEKHVPEDVSAQLDVPYAPEPDTYLDVYFPTRVRNTGMVLPTIVWIHGGAWISGTRKDVGNYLKILAGRGYTAVAVGYSIAPGAKYPTPIRQVNAALDYLQKRPRGYHVDAERIVIAGDSAGAQIAAEVANIVSVPSYAEAIGVEPGLPRERLKGAILNCGIYDVGAANLDEAFGGFLRTVLWSYSGTRDFAGDPRFATVSVVNYVTADFPPTYISGGNGDPLTPQSKAFAAALAERGVPVDTLFFTDDTAPPLARECQFNLDTEAGQLALDQTLAFLQRVFDQLGLKRPPPLAGQSSFSASSRNPSGTERGASSATEP